MRLGWGALLGIALLSIACGGAAQGGSSSSAVPWLPLAKTGTYPEPASPKPSPPIPIPPGTPACTSAQVEVTLYHQSGATGHTNTPLLLRNRSAADCFLEGYPDVIVLDAQGKVLAAGQGTAHRGTFFELGVAVVPILMKSGTISVPQDQPSPPLGQAVMNVEWVDCSQPAAARIMLDLPGGGGKVTAAYAVKAGYSPACDSGPGYAPQAAVSRGPLYPTGTQWPPAPAYISVKVSIDAPGVVKRGSTLVYLVTLRNTSDIDYVLDPCPDYNEFLGNKDLVASYRLNCAPVGHIAPGSAVTFEMHMTLPSFIESGPSRLYWSLGDGRLAKANDVVPITIG